MREIILYFSLKYEGDFKKIYEALSSKERIDESLKQELFSKMKCDYVTLFDDNYPKSLKLINCPPFVLYYYGDFNLLQTLTIGVVGSREASDYGQYVTLEFVRELCKNGYTIVSGLAKGIDAIAHQSAIDNKGKTIAVLPTGIEYCYPHTHLDLYEKIKKDYLLISEYPFLTTPKKEAFSFRNRIITGLSSSLLVCEAKQRSGTMVSVGYALEQGKNVYAVPSRIDDKDGCNILIQQGAKLVMNVNDILEEEYN